MVDELRGHGHTAFAFKADVSSEDDVAKMFEAVRDEFGTVDILVNNAGAPIGRVFRSDDPGAMEQSDRCESDWSIFMRTRSGSRVQAPRRASANLMLCGKDYLHQLSPRSDPLGWSRELRCVQRRRDANDEKHRPGSRALSHPCEFNCTGRDPDTD